MADNDEAKDIVATSPNIHQVIKNSFVFKQQTKQVERDSIVYSSSKLMRPPLPFFECHDGGILSADGKCVYFIGIIDTLTFFG